MSDDQYRYEYEGYSDYKTVSNRVGQSIDDAVRAYAALESLHLEGARVRRTLAAEIRQDILSAAMMLIPDLQGSQFGDEEDDDPFEDILDRWGVEDGQFTDDGYLAELRGTSLQENVPEWLYRLVVDIRTAGWEIGYLRAGRINQERDLDDDERQASEFFES